MKSIDLCGAHALRPFVRCLKNQGIATDRLLEEQQIPPELVAEGSGHIAKRQAWRFFAEVSRSEGIGSLGFLCGDRFTIGDLGSLGQALSSAVTLKDAIGTFSRLVSTFAQGNTVRLDQGAERTWLSCHTERLGPTDFVPDDFTIVVLTGLIRLATGPAWRPQALRFQTAPSDCRKPSAEFSDLEVSFLNSGSAIAFPSSLLSMPLLSDGAVRKPPALEPFAALSSSDALRRILASLRPFRSIPDSRQAGEMLSVSRRTLSRSLKAEGVTYRQLLDRVRFDAARTLLLESDCRINEIAYETGYSGANNFVRAFRRFTGTTPTEFRLHHRHKVTGDE